MAHGWTPKDLTALQLKQVKQPRSKYRSQKTEKDGIVFDSAKEANRHGMLCLMLKAGLIRDLVRQVPFELFASNGAHVGIWFADFVYFDLRTNARVVEDTKSPATRKIAVYRLKKKLVEACHGIEIREV
jgi:hypothetical protein